MSQASQNAKAPVAPPPRVAAFPGRHLPDAAAPESRRATPPVPEAIPGPPVYAVAVNPQPQAIVIHCGDPRFQDAFGDFIKDELRLSKDQFIPFIVGGGAGPLAHPERLPKEFKFMRERLETYRTKFLSIRRIILINHEDCGYYKALKERALGAIAEHIHLSQAHEDLGGIAAIFSRLLPHLGVSVEKYYARFADPEHTTVQFEKVSL